MAEMVTIDGQVYTKRNPLGVLGLTVITIGIYGFVWYYKINDEIRRYTRDETISPARSLVAIILGWIIIVPPFIAMYNTAKHVRAMEEGVGIQQQLGPALTIILMILLSIANGLYIQEHVNRVWDRGAGAQARAVPRMPPPPPVSGPS